MSTDYLYRIAKFTNVIDLFENKSLRFSLPSSWDDPYERILKHKRSGHIFAQCWSKKAVSDAMWRIYSTERIGIRIRTSRHKLEDALRKSKKGKISGYMLRDVEYLPRSELDSRLSDIASDLKIKYRSNRAAQALLIKRDAFDHESEVRAIVSSGKGDLPFLRIPVDPHDFIENIYFDPRVDPIFEKVCTHYLKMALKYRGTIGRSSLYKDRDAILTET